MTVISPPDEGVEVLTLADVCTQLDAMEDRLIELARTVNILGELVEELHATFAPLMPMIAAITGDDTGANPMAGNPMLALLGGMNL